MNYIIFDLEWNQAADKQKSRPDLTFEIIEIGAIKMTEQGVILDEFSRLIRPVVYPELFYRVREVVGITKQELKKGVPFTQALQEFVKWCGEDYIFCTWGSMDLTELQRNIVYHKIPVPFEFPLYYYDVQKLYSLFFGDGKSRLSLEAAVDELKLRIDGPFHRAVSDAYYTALVLTALNMGKLRHMLSVDYFHLPKTREEELYLVFDNYSKFVSRLFSNREEAMKDPGVTSTVCYLCGHNVRRRLNWFSDNSNHYYSLSCCPEHGWLRGKIRVKKAKNNHIFIVKTIKQISQEEADVLIQKQSALREKRRAKRRSDE